MITQEIDLLTMEQSKIIIAHLYYSHPPIFQIIDLSFSSLSKLRNVRVSFFVIFSTNVLSLSHISFGDFGRSLFEIFIGLSFHLSDLLSLILQLSFRRSLFDNFCLTTSLRSITDKLSPIF